MELLAENVSLCAPNEKLITEGKFGDFKTTDRDIPQLGKVYLAGSRSSFPKVSDQGVFISDQIYKLPALKIDSIPCFYSLQVIARPSQDLGERLYICRLKFPDIEKTLESDLGFNEDDLEEDTYFRFTGTTYNWKINEEFKTYWLFGLKHPLYLSGLRFKFGYI